MCKCVQFESILFDAIVGHFIFGGDRRIVQDKRAIIPL